MIRKPAVAGMFYESDPARLQRVIRGFLKEEPRTEALGVMVPHAGYVYSGAVAGEVYSRITPRETYILLGPNHTGQGPAVSMMCRGEWETPLGTMKIDQRLASSVLGGSGVLQEDTRAHALEHSIEVQLPFLQMLGGGTFVPIILMGIDYQDCEEIASAIVEAVKASDRPVLIVASSDMTHFERQESAGRKDRLALEKLEALDPEGLYDVVQARRISMCGFIPATVMLIAAKALGATRAAVVRYATSGDVTGDMDQVVGYAGVIVE
ncbi:MAG: AmmeMemoRadiSam system protein B [bacterium]